MKKELEVSRLGSYFESLSDPRHERNRKHRLSDILVIAVCATFSDCKGPLAIHRWDCIREEWLRRFLPLPNGIPSRDCIRRMLIAIKPDAFQKSFEAWTRDIIVTNETGLKQLVAIDGKSCRSSHDRSKDLGPLHIVSAWATEEGLALGQVATDDKSNEITAIPQLLSQLSLRDAIVTIDAIGCQKNIVEQIDEAKGTYVIAVKENQPTLAAEVRKLISEQMEGDREELLDRSYGTREKGHGRIDERTYRIMKLPQKGSLHKE